LFVHSAQSVPLIKGPRLSCNAELVENTSLSSDLYDHRILHIPHEQATVIVTIKIVQIRGAYTWLEWKTYEPHLSLYNEGQQKQQSNITS